jgi:sugar phosphate isomerase/epimerase
VFGSPKNRRIGTLPRDEAFAIAVEFFTKLGAAAASAGTCIVMEANPPLYGADFITRAAEALDLVRAVNHPGFRLHLDSGCMALSADPIAASVDEGFGFLKHFHVSEPNLDPPGSSGKVDHGAFRKALHTHGYNEWVSLEMREPQPFTLDSFTHSLRWFCESYTLW